MSVQPPVRDRIVGVPRKRKTYRGWRRNNAISWEGAPTQKKEQPKLEMRISKRGEKHYQTAKE